MTDDELISAIAGGDPKAFNELYRHFQTRVYRTAFQYLQQVHDAEELTQDVFVQVYRSAAKYNYKASVSTWIYRITVNKCLDKLRYAKAKKRFAFITQLFQHEEQHPVPDNKAHTAATEENAALYLAIDRLPEKQKTALILTQLEELSIKETAAIMDTSPKAVESLTQRAKSNLRIFLKK